MGLEFEVWIVIILCFTFFISGFVDSVAGGGGLINIPIFLLVGAPPEFALGTTKMSATIGKIAALINYAKNALIDWRLAFAGLPAAIIGGVLGTKAILYFDSANIGKIILFLLPIGVIAILLPRKSFDVAKKITKIKLYLITPIICLFLGFYDGFFGPGVGSFFIIALNFFIGLSLVKAAAMTKVFNLATAFSSFIVFAIEGKIFFAVGILLIFFSVIGNIVGSSLAIKIGSDFVKKVLLFSLSLLFVSLMWKLFI
ncbi:MAG: TSUP family transporter [Campylobacteraceae bacterium]|nr:TSUP family transporter [Campylobacteraceae bacterium]